MNREDEILWMAGKTFCDIRDSSSRTSELGSSPVKNYDAATWITSGWPSSFPRVRRATFYSEQFVGGFCSARVLGTLIKRSSFSRSKDSSLPFPLVDNFNQKCGGRGLLERFKEVNKAVPVQTQVQRDRTMTAKEAALKVLRLGGRPTQLTLERYGVDPEEAKQFMWWYNSNRSKQFRKKQFRKTKHFKPILFFGLNTTK